MTQTRMPPGCETLSKKLLAGLLAGVVLQCGCTDLALEANRIPARMTLSPDSGLLTVGEPAKLEFVVRDQNGEVMTVPGWIPPVWELSDDSVAEMSRDGTLTGKKGGRVVVTARLANLKAEARFRVNPDRIVLTSPVIYLNQAAQNRMGSVRLVAGRPALLRVFVVGDQVNWLESPAVKVTLLRDNEVVFQRILQPQTERIPDSVDESDFKWSHNVEVPGFLIRPGVRMVVELDPEGVVPLAPGSRIRYPEEGSAELLVVKPQLFRQIFVPTLWIQAPDHSVFDWLDGMDPESWQVRYTRSLLPVSDMEVEVRDTFWTNADLSTGAGWTQWLGEMRVLHLQEGRRGYYYGVVGSGPAEWGGLAGKGVPWSVGLPDDRVYTHELGHNMNLGHAPCGGAWFPDPNYPYRRGSIGTWGYDPETGALVAPGEYSDIMGYCRVRFWISDYHFNRATTHRLAGDGGVDPGGGPEPGRGQMLVVWGSVRGGGLTLDPAFVLEGPVELPDTDGPYRVEGLGADGESAFSLSFTPTPREGGGAGFAYFVPYRPEWATTLDRIVLTGPEGEDIVTRDGEPEMAVLTDASTGTIRAIVRNWDGGPLPAEETADVTISGGIPTAEYPTRHRRGVRD